MNQETETFDPGDMYHMFDLKPLNKDIFYFKNVVSYPKELIEFINEIDNDPESYSVITKWSQWTASNNNDFVYGKNKNIMPASLTEENKNTSLGKKMLYIKNSFEMAFKMCLDTYLKSQELDPEMYDLRMSQIPIRQWVGPGMGPHCDTYDGDNDLAFSMIVYLNDEYEGGTIDFPNHNISLKPEAASLVIFPSQEPYLHEVKDVISGERYTSHISVYKK
jgi:hypothetical protein